MGVTSSVEDGIDLVRIEHGGITEIYSTLLPGAEHDVASLLHRFQRLVPESGVEFLEMRVFGNPDSLASFGGVFHEIFGPTEWPQLILHGEDCFGGKVAGIQIHAVAGTPVETISLGGSPLGRVFESDYARYCVLGNLHSPEISLSPARQTRDTIEQMMEGLDSAGMDIHNLVRTWFFIDDILGWYPIFNGVRSEIYSDQGVFGRYVPASTGIGVENSDSTALLASALGMKAKGEGVTVREIPSPLQCPAIDYGSSFSRAAEVVTPDSRWVYVSGTASIDADGASVNLGDVDAQISHTLQIVGAILESRSMDFSDVVRGNAYFRNPSEAGILEEHSQRHGLPTSRIIVSHDDVCRDDLLFEMEVTAVKADQQPHGPGRAEES
jgi:enamine deaminase RidA (YjgF/YER057c/UK114 family)